MTSFNGYIQGITSGEKRTVDKTGKMVTVSAYDNIDNLIVFNEAGETSQKTLSGKNLFKVLPYADWLSVGSYILEKNILPDNTNLIMSFTDNDTSIDVSGIYLGFCENSYSGGYLTNYNWCMANGNIMSNTTNINEGLQLSAIVLYPTTEETYNKLFARYKIQIEVGSTATAYEEYCGGKPSPNPDYPQDIKGIGVKRQDGTYDVFLDYDAGDEEHFGRITATGLAYPLYEGDILDFVNSKVIRAKGCLTKAIANMNVSEDFPGWSNSGIRALMGSGINQNYTNPTVYCNIGNNFSVNTAGGSNDIIFLPKTTYGGLTQSQWITQYPDLTATFVFPLATPTDEPITLIGGDITDIGTAVVTADGTLTIKYDKAKMAIQKYRNPPEWSDIGYDSTPSEIITAFNYAKNLQDSWTGVRNFYGVKELYFFPDVNMKNSRSYNGMFQNTNLMHVPPIEFGEETITGNANANDMFRLTYVEDVSLTAVDSTQKFEMQRTFYECFLLKSVTLNLKTFGNINALFYNCKKLTSVSGEFDTSEVTNFGEAFRGCNSLTHAPSLDTSSCTSFWRTFTDCTSLTSAPNWNLRNATDLSQMFWGCTALRIVPLYYIPNATNLNGMFQGIGSNLEAGDRNNILLMCAHASSYTGTKTLAQLGFNSSMYPASSWQGLSKYADFIDAGWTIGYN